MIPSKWKQFVFPLKLSDLESGKKKSSLDEVH